MATHPIMFDEADPVLMRVRALSLALPGAEERIAHGRPWFFAGRAFAVYGGGTKGPDAVRHDHGLLVHVDDDERPARMADARFFVPAYVGPKGWLGIDVGAPETDWAEVAELLDASFRWMAPPPLVRELDAREVRPGLLAPFRISAPTRLAAGDPHGVSPENSGTAR